MRRLPVVLADEGRPLDVRQQQHEGFDSRQQPRGGDAHGVDARRATERGPHAFREWAGDLGHPRVAVVLADVRGAGEPEALARGVASFEHAARFT